MAGHVRHTDLIPAIYGHEDDPDWKAPHIDEVAMWQRIEDLGARYTRGRANFYRVMVLRYREHEPRRAIADLFGVHQSRIAQIEAKMLRLLRHPASRAVYERTLEVKS